MLKFFCLIKRDNCRLTIKIEKTVINIIIKILNKTKSGSSARMGKRGSSKRLNSQKGLAFPVKYCILKSSRENLKQDNIS